MARNKIIYWTTILGTLIIFLALGLVIGNSKGHAQTETCMELILVNCTTAATCDPDCGVGWTMVGNPAQTGYTVRVALCAQ